MSQPVSLSRTDAAVLGMLTLEPMSGYDMKKFSEQGLVHFWHVSYGNLYPRLKRLEARGLIEGRRETREGAPDATVYTIMATGRRRFRDWLDEDPRPERVRSELVLKLFFGADGGPELAADRIAEHRRRQEEIRSRYAAIETLLRDETDGQPEAPYWRMALRRGQLLTEARIRWCDECAAALDRIPDEEDR